MKNELTLHITLLQPPGDTDFGLQKGKGNDYETIQKQRSGNGDLHFEAIINTKQDKNNKADFTGPLVHGPIGERFLYIDIGTYAGQSNSVWGRRLKIPLASITNQVLEQLSRSPNHILQTHIAGTGKDGGPTCGTVKPFEGWKIASPTR
jgi:hypothetical protein